ncbi:DEAD/DEAH box helicase family protein [Kribbella sp. NBC_01505]|uniref:DEAD/DEAH box helicase n=1 Tax=Kribbella sp. NBC_01505 TaxID=2903580 RepID=UPI00386AD5DC
MTHPRLLAIDGNPVFCLDGSLDPGGPRIADRDAIRETYERAFLWDEAFAEGLRPPQIGATLSVLGYWTRGPTEPATVVMPTGTGKTDTMIAVFVAGQLQRLLVVVPTDALREQIADKFLSLGILPLRRLVKDSARMPVVGRVERGFKSVSSAREFAAVCNVVVATPNALAASSEEARTALLAAHTHLFVDEAHHIAAKTWNRLREMFGSKPVVQFTATPFRRDHRRLGGRSVYTFSLRQAQRLGIYSSIDYLPVTPRADTDLAIAQVAIARLREDLDSGFDHLMMARARSIAEATRLHALYCELAPDLEPQLLHSKVGAVARRSAFATMDARTSRIVVCVDMLGEGYDLPQLKVAALHDVHRSLGITLQFVGRFARTSDSVGPACVVAPRRPARLDENLRQLYQEDADWNLLIRDLSEGQVAEQEAVDEFESGFGDEGTALSVRNALPKMSAVVYRTECDHWNLAGLAELFTPEDLLTGQFVVNAEWHVLWFVTEDRQPVVWQGLATVEDVSHELYVFYWNEDQGLLYINCSANDGHYEAEAQALCGGGARLVRGTAVYRAMAALERRVPTTVGLLDSRNRWRRFTSHTGADVSEGFPQVEAQTKAQTNIFAVGYEAGRRVSVGASRKGRIWSYQSVPTLKHWVDWCDVMGARLIDESIDIEAVLAGFIRPEMLDAWPDLVALAVEWPVELAQVDPDSTVIELGADAVPLIFAELAIVEHVTGPPLVAVRTDGWEAQYRVDIDQNGMVVTPVGPDPVVRRARSSQTLSKLLGRRGFRILLEGDAVVEQPGVLLRPRRDLSPFDPERLQPVGWEGIDIRRESRGPSKDPACVQARALEHLLEEAWDVVVDDDGAGEVADLVALRRSGDALVVRLVHCKYSSKSSPGSRVDDFYELCGQAQKSARHRDDLYAMVERLIRREQHRSAAGRRTGIERGSVSDLYRLGDELSLLTVTIEIVLVQPGLSQSAVSDSVLHLLASTEIYVGEVGAATLYVHCSE